MKATMRIAAICAASVSMLFLSGCVPQLYLRDTPSVTVSTFDKINGSWKYTIDDSIKDARRTAFKPSGHVCSAHTYTLTAGDQLTSAVRKMLEDITEGSQDDSKNTITVRLESFSPRFSCAMGVIEGTCTGTTEIALAFSVTKDGKKSNFTVTSERSADAPAGQLCDKALDAPAEATRKAIKDVLERASERITSLADK